MKTLLLCDIIVTIKLGCLIARDQSSNIIEAEICVFRMVVVVI